MHPSHLWYTSGRETKKCSEHLGTLNLRSSLYLRVGGGGGVLVIPDLVSGIRGWLFVESVHEAPAAAGSQQEQQEQEQQQEAAGSRQEELAAASSNQTLPPPKKSSPECGQLRL